MKSRAAFCGAIAVCLAGAVVSGMAQSTVLYTEDFEAWSGVFDNNAQYTNEFALTTTASGGTWSFSPNWMGVISNATTTSFALNLPRPADPPSGGKSSAAIALAPSLFTQGPGHHRLSVDFVFAADGASRLWAEVWECETGSGGPGNYYEVPNVVYGWPVPGLLPITTAGDASASQLINANWGGGLAGSTVEVDFTYNGTGAVVLRIGGGRATGPQWAVVRADNVVLTHEVGPIILTQPQDQAVLLGTTGTVLSVEAEGVITSYQWLRNGGAILGATDQTYELPSVGFSETGNYAVVVSDASGPSTSEVAQVTIVPAPIEPGSQSVLVGQPVTFSVTMPDAGTTYQWTKDGTNLTGETGATLFLSSVGLAETGTYAVVTTLGGDSVDSEAATLSVFAGTVDVVIENGDFETPSSPSPINDVEGWLEQEDQIYSVRIQRPALAGGVNQVLRLGYSYDTVNLRQLLPVTFRSDLDYTLSFDVFGSTNIDGEAGTGANTDYWVTFNDPGGAGLVYRVDLTTPTTPTAVNVSLPACVAKIAEGRTMQIRFNKGDTRPGGIDHFVWIDNVQLTAVAAAPEVCIGRQPEDQTLILGATQAVFSVVAAGAEPVSYTWYQDGVGMVGTGENLIIPSPGNADEGDYYVIVSNDLNTVTSEVAVLNLGVGSMTPVWQRAYAGATAAISVGMLQGAAGYSYAWKKDGVPVPGATEATLVLGCVEPADAGAYTAVVSLGGSSVESWNAVLVVLPPPSDYAAAVLADGPIAWWRLGEATGPTAVEEMAARNGTYGSGAQLGAAGALIYDSDAAVNFTGATTSLVEVADGSTLSPAVFSVEFWAMVTGGAGTREAVANMDVFGSFETGGWAFRPIDGGSWQFRLVSAADTVSTVTAPAAEGQWHHVVGTYNGSVMALYINGYEVGSKTNGYVVQGATVVPFRIGAGGAVADSANPDFFFVGMVDEVALYDRALSLSEIQGHYANGMAPTYLCMEPVGGGMQLKWSWGVLQTNDNLLVDANWNDVPGATSPYTPVLNQQQNNYRVWVPVP